MQSDGYGSNQINLNQMDIVNVTKSEYHNQENSNTQLSFAATKQPIKQLSLNNNLYMQNKKKYKDILIEAQEHFEEEKDLHVRMINYQPMNINN